MVTGLIPHCVLTKNHFIDEKITTVQGVELYVQKVKRQFFWLIHTSNSPEKLWKPKYHLSYILGDCCNYVIILLHFLVVLATDTMNLYALNYHFFGQNLKKFEKIRNLKIGATGQIFSYIVYQTCFLWIFSEKLFEILAFWYTFMVHTLSYW